MCASYCACLLLAIGTPAARAQEGCQEAFEAELTRLRGAGESPENQRYRTSFSRAGETLQATIRAEDGSSRVLEALGPDCRALASAAAVALTLLLDAERALPSPAPSNTRAPTRAAAPDVVAPRAPPPESSVHAGAGAGILLGVPRDVAAVLLGSLGARRGRLRAELGVLWALPRVDPLGPGSVRSELVAGDLRACLTLVPHLALCSGSYLGQLDMRARGYTRNERARTLWGAAPIELTLDYLWAHVGAELSAGVLIPFARKRFVIEGVVDTREDAPVQALFALRVFGTQIL